MSEPSSQDNPVFNLTTVHVVARCIHVIADAGVADALDEEPRPAAELAAATGLNADPLGRILRLLSTYGLFAGTAVDTSTPQGLGCCAATIRSRCGRSLA